MKDFGTNLVPLNLENLQNLRKIVNGEIEYVAILTDLPVSDVQLDVGLLIQHYAKPQPVQVITYDDIMGSSMSI